MIRFPMLIGSLRDIRRKKALGAHNIGSHLVIVFSDATLAVIEFSNTEDFRRLSVDEERFGDLFYSRLWRIWAYNEVCFWPSSFLASFGIFGTEQEIKDWQSKQQIIAHEIANREYEARRERYNLYTELKKEFEDSDFDFEEGHREEEDFEG